MSDLLKDEEFCRWVKSVMALEMTRSPLAEFVEPVIMKRHKEIVDKMFAAGSICSLCSFEDADKCPSCKIMKDKITKDHRFDRPTFRNRSIKDCVTNPWKLAKCYMAAGYEMAHSLTDTDTVGFLQLIINNMIFQYHTSENLNDLNNIFQQVREVRNFIMHSPENRTTKSTFDIQVKVIVEMLQSLHTPSSKRTIQRVKQLQTDKVSLEDIHHANSEAVKFFKNYEAELRERIKECEHRMAKIEDTITQGQHNIAGSIELGLHNIHEKTVRGKRALEDATNRGTKLIREETDVGIQKLDDKANKSTRILVEKVKDLDEHFKESREQLGEGISRIKDVRNEAMEAMDKVKKIKFSAKLIDEKTINDIDTIQKVTQLCMEKLCEQTKASGETMQDTREKLDDEFKQRMDEQIGSAMNIAMNKKLAELKQFESRMRKMVEMTMNGKLSELKQYFSHEMKRRENTDNCTNEKISRYERISINISHSQKENYCWIGSMTKIDARRLAVVDQRNNSVKIIDVEKNSVADHMKMSVMPVAIACIDESHLVVACEEKTLLFLRLGGKLRRVNTVQLESEPVDVVSLNGDIGVLFGGQNPCIKILSLSGETKRTCTESMSGATHIATNRCKTILHIVYNTEADCIAIIDLDLNDQQLRRVRQIKIPYVFKEPHATMLAPYPPCLTVDQNDNVYVTDRASGRIVRITAYGDSNTLIDKQDLLSYPTSLEYCQMENKLYVGFGDRKEMMSLNIANT